MAIKIMFRCNFCDNIAVFECTENKFCGAHRLEHDKTHTGRHLFKDVFCRLSKEVESDLRSAISKRLIKLKECKNAFTASTAEYIKNIQVMLFQKIAEIDKLSQFYMDLLEKPDFEREDSAEIDKILSTRIEIKQLEHFTDFGFKDYLKQDIIELKQIALLSHEGIFLVDILRLCKAKKIPERMLK